MVKTLNVRGLNDYSSEVCNFLQDIESSFLDVINTYQEPKCQMVEAEKVKNTIEVLGECFAAGTAPADSFHCFSCGDFELTYMEIQPLVTPASTISCNFFAWCP